MPSSDSLSARGPERGNEPRLTVEELTALEAKATPAPWVAEVFPTLTAARKEAEFTWATSDCYNGQPVGKVWKDCGGGVSTGLPGSVEVSAADAELIVAMRNALPSLLADLARLTRERDEAREEVEEWIEREAAVCPEDFGFEEVITIQTRRAELAEAEVSRLTSELDRVRGENETTAKDYVGACEEVRRLRKALHRTADAADVCEPHWVIRNLALSALGLSTPDATTRREG